MQNKLAITVSDRFERRIDRLFDQIDEAVDQLNWDFVRDRAQTVLTLDPDNADALRFLASSDRALGGLTQAAAIHSLSPPPVVLAPELARTESMNSQTQAQEAPVETEKTTASPDRSAQTGA